MVPTPNRDPRLARPLRVLLIEDDDHDAQLILGELERGGYAPSHERVADPAALEAALGLEWDIVLSDYTLGGWDATDALRILRRKRPNLPFVVVTGTLGEEKAVAVIKDGASDFLLKNRLSRLGPMVDAQLKGVEERRQAEGQFLALWDASLDVLLLLNEDGHLIRVSAAADRVLGYDPDTLAGKHVSVLLPRAPGPKPDELLRAIRNHGAVFESQQFLRADGSTCPMDLTGTIIPWAAGKAILVTLRDVSEREAGALALRRSEERFERVFRLSPVATSISTVSDGRYLDVNERFLTLVGYPREAVLGRTSLELGLWADPADRDAMTEALQAKGELHEWNWRYRMRNGEVREARSSFVGIHVQGEPHLLALTEDITERKHLEEQLLQAQKMEAVGRLAGGVAHDFNNLLGVITGYTELLLRGASREGQERRKLEQIGKAASRAAGLTRQLLAFSRRQVFQPVLLELNEVLAEAQAMLHRLIGEDIDLVWRPGPEPGFVKADRGQIEQVLMNLAVNARDAMPAGGSLTIEAENSDIDRMETVHHEPVEPGSYATFSVSDSGCGMDERTLARVFEPFFTTKPAGKGTGLGLSTAYGIVKQSGGHIRVQSEPLKGSTFRVFLPRVEGARLAASEPPARDDAPGRGETLLVVEDQEELRELTLEVLRGYGYAVLAARDGVDALKVAELSTQPIQLLLTDVVMPRMGGHELAQRLAAVRPGIKVLFTSGYTDETVMRHGIFEGKVEFLQKPYLPEVLAQKIRAVLDSP